MMTTHNVLQHEFIGRDIVIVDARNASLTGITGRVIDETRNMFIVDTSHGEKKILKNDVRIQIRTQEQDVIVDGDVLVGRPEDRIKK